MTGPRDTSRDKWGIVLELTPSAREYKVRLKRNSVEQVGASRKGCDGHVF